MTCVILLPPTSRVLGLLLSIFLCLSLFCSLSLSRSFVCKQPGLRIRDRMRFEFHCSCYRCLAEFIPSFKTIKNLTSNITEIPTPGFTTPLLISEQSLSYKTSCPSGLPCVRNPESKGKAGGPWTHRWHGPTKTIYVVVKTYLQIPSVRNGKVAKPKTTHADMP